MTKLLIDGMQDIFGKKIENIKELSGGLTNKVYLIGLEGNERVVVKIGEDLLREREFFGFISQHNQSFFPKLLDSKNGNKILVLEFREGINGKEIVNLIDDDNWESIGIKFGEILKKLHQFQTNINPEEQIVSVQKMINYLSLNPQVFSQYEYNRELDIFKRLILDSNEGFVILHGDFSPHNCLFTKDEQNHFIISTILDPSARVGFGIKFFDIVYLFNTRWNKSNGRLEKGFLKSYNIDLCNPLFIQLEKMMRMYLIEVYYSMGDMESMKTITEKLNTI